MILISACQGTGDGVADGGWQLVEGSIDGIDFYPPPPTRRGDMTGSGRPVLLTITTGQVDGHGPCNDYGGLMRVSELDSLGSRKSRVVIEWGDVFSTLRGCVVAGIQEIEQAYFDALMRTDRGRRVGNSLTLTGDGARLRFELVLSEGGGTIRADTDVQVL
jgi:hypothetical protein